MKKNNTHDKGIEQIVQRLTNSSIKYDIFTNLEYGPHHKLIGEIDVFATTGKYNLFFEYKSNDLDKNYNTAIKQLSRIHDKYANPYARNWYFYVTQDNIEKNLKHRRVETENK